MRGLPLLRLGRLPVIGLLLGLGAFAALGCLGSSSDSGSTQTYPGGCCCNSTASLCQEYGEASVPSAYANQCQDQPSLYLDNSYGTYSSFACPTANRVGTCAFTDALRSGVTLRYYGNGFSVSTAQQSCTASSGTFTAN